MVCFVMIFCHPNIMQGLMSMTPIQSGYYGFLTGFATAGTGSSLLYYAKRTMSVDTHAVKWRSLGTLNANEDVRSVMGGHLTAGEMSAFRHQRGAWTVSNWRPMWSPAKTQMVYNVYTDKTEGVVSVDAFQNGLHTDISFIGLDVSNQQNSRVLVKGNAKGFEIHDALKAIVSFKSMKK